MDIYSFTYVYNVYTVTIKLFDYRSEVLRTLTTKKPTTVAAAKPSPAFHQEAFSPGIRPNCFKCLKRNYSFIRDIIINTILFFKKLLKSISSTIISILW